MERNGLGDFFFFFSGAHRWDKKGDPAWPEELDFGPDERGNGVKNGVKKMAGETLSSRRRPMLGSRANIASGQC